MQSRNDVILEGTLILLALWVAYQLFWRRALIDRFRQELFQIRDSLFLQTASLGAFQDPAYGMLRIMLNRLIASSARFSLPHALLATVFMQRLRPKETSLEHKFTQCVERIGDPETKKVYSETYHRMIQACAKHIFRSWIPLMSVFVALLFVIIPLRIALRFVQSGFSEWVGEIYADRAIALIEDQQEAQLAV
jgi:hypothetical protein